MFSSENPHYFWLDSPVWKNISGLCREQRQSNWAPLLWQIIVTKNSYTYTLWVILNFVSLHIFIFIFMRYIFRLFAPPAFPPPPHATCFPLHFFLVLYFSSSLFLSLFFLLLNLTTTFSISIEWCCAFAIDLKSIYWKRLFAWEFLYSFLFIAFLIIRT